MAKKLITIDKAMQHITLFRKEIAATKLILKDEKEPNFDYWVEHLDEMEELFEFNCERFGELVANDIFKTVGIPYQMPDDWFMYGITIY